MHEGERLQLERQSEEIISKARLHIILDSPFFGSILSRVQVENSWFCPTAWTDGKMIGMNPAMVTELPFEHVKGVIVHEIGHIIFKHQLRRGDREPRTWNEAGDYVINAMIKTTEGVSLPDWTLLDTRWMDAITEDVYASLWEDLSEEEKQSRTSAANGEQPSEDGNPADAGQMGDCWKDGTIDPTTGKGMGNGQIGDVIDFTGDDGNAASPGEIAEYEGTLDTAIRQAAAVAQKHGTMDAAMAEQIKAAGESKTSWYDQLNQFLVDMVDDDYTWKRPKTDYVMHGVYMPVIEGEGLPPVVIGLDVSGSMTNDQLMQTGKEVCEIIDTFGCDVHIIFHNTKVCGVQKVEAADLNPEDFVLDFSASGGTAYTPVFKYIEEEMDGEEPYALLMFTDLECDDFPDHEPDYPVIWCQFKDFDGFSHYESEPPFGEWITIDLHD